MKKRLLSLGLALNMTFSMLPATALAADESSEAGVSSAVQGAVTREGDEAVATYEAELDGVQYATLAEAFAKVEEIGTSGQTLKLLSDVTVTEQILVSNQEVLYAFTLDGNGKTITAEGLGSSQSVLRFGKGAAEACEVDIQDLTIVLPEGEEAQCGILLSGGHPVDGVYPGMALSQVTNVTVEGAFSHSGIAFTGTHGGTMTDCDVVSVFTNGKNDVPLNLVSTQVGTLYANRTGEATQQAKIFIDDASYVEILEAKGSTEMVDPASLARVGQVINSVTNEAMAAEVDSVQYPTLVEAFAKVEEIGISGQTIKLLSDVTLTEQIKITNQNVLDDITLDGQNHTITASGLNPENQSVLYFGDPSNSRWACGVKIKNLTITTGEGQARFGIALMGGTASELTNVTVEGDYVYGVNFYGTHGAAMTDCNVVSAFVNGQYKYPLELINTKIGTLVANRTSEEIQLPKVFLDKASFVETLKVAGNTEMIDPASLARVGQVINSVTNEAMAAEVNGVQYATLSDALTAAKEGDTVTLMAGEWEEGVIKLPATLKNVTIQGAADHGTVLKNTVVQSADGTSLDYEGLTFDGIVFDNSRLLFTGWRAGPVNIADITVTNCVFQNIVAENNCAAVHFNVSASEAVNGFTFIGNKIDGVTGSDNSGVYITATGNITIQDNVIHNVAFRPYLVSLIDNDGIEDALIVTGNTFSGSSVGRAQANGQKGSDTVTLVVSNNVFQGITNAQQICYWNFSTEGNVTHDISGNYYDIDISANPGKIYFNKAAASEEDLGQMGVYPVYTKLNNDGSIDTDSATAPVVSNGVYYGSLSAAVAAAQDGDTVTLLKDMTGAGIVIDTSAKSLTIDLDGHTYSVDTSVGSSDTVSNGFQLLKGGSVTIQNGTLKPANPAIKVMIQNYCDLTLKNVTVDCSESSDCLYAVSNNHGTVNITGDTSIYVTEGGCAFDLFYWPDGGYGDGVTVNVNTTGIISGRIEYGSDKTTAGMANVADKAKLNIQNGTFEGTFSLYGLGEDEASGISITGGTFSSDPSAYVSSGYTAQKSGANWNVVRVVVSGGSSSATTTTDKTTTTNPDGSITTTVTDKVSGVVTETTTTTDGVIGTTVTDAQGAVTEMTVTVSSAAAASGEAVTLPVQVEATDSAETAPVLNVTVPASAGAVQVVIPVTEAKPGVVAVLVKADGTEEIIKTSVVDENGVLVTVEGAADLKLVDNTTNFDDVDSDHWFDNAVAFVAAREIMTGTGNNSFAPQENLTRGMIAQVLYSLQGKPEAGENTFDDVNSGAWYADAVSWAAENGLVSGTAAGIFAPEANVTREQMAVILCGYAKLLGMDTTTGNSLDQFQDGASASDWAQSALEWALHAGLLSGKDGGKLDPTGTATRAEVAQILANFCQLMAR